VLGTARNERGTSERSSLTAKGVARSDRGKRTSCTVWRREKDDERRLSKKGEEGKRAFSWCKKGKKKPRKLKSLSPISGYEKITEKGRDREGQGTRGDCILKWGAHLCRRRKLP